MRKKCMKKQGPFFLCIVLIVAMALSASGCSGTKESREKQAQVSQEQTKQDSKKDALTETKGNVQSDSETGIEGNVRGEGETEFDFLVVDREGEETWFEIHTDKEIVGEALQDVGLIEGEEGDYGLFVKTVNGISADYDKDGVYWAFYINDEYAAEGVDSTKITEGDTYAFKVEAQ